MSIINPIIRGFNPDPSIIKVGDDYYIATSTFEWFPGVQIHHSTDLVNWELITHPLNRVSQLDMKGVPDSCGVWAPCLSYDNDIYYLVYSVAKSFQGIWKDTPNYLVTASDIKGEWSEPVFLSSMGFDGSLFHDDDGRKWYTSLLVDHRNNKLFGGIAIQEYDHELKKLTGKPRLIFEGTALGITEGPHLYKKDDYYYLLTAEGGTEYGHAVTIARSKDIFGPYEIHPDNPILSSRYNPEHPLQKAGHADLVHNENDNWFMVYLTSRPLSELGRCTLGRETGIEQVVWKKGDWPRLATGAKTPRIEIPYDSKERQPLKHLIDNFEDSKFDINWNSLRVPIDTTWLNLEDNKLRLLGRESLSSTLEQSMLARRVQHLNIEATTSLQFNPESFQQMAGLTCYYNTYHYHYLNISTDFNGMDKILSIISCDKYNLTHHPESPVNIGQVDTVYLKVHFNRAEIQFSYSLDNNHWIIIGPVLDGSILSDDYVRDEENRYRAAFTGAFIGLCCQDLSGQKLHADFNHFEYKELEP